MKALSPANKDQAAQDVAEGRLEFREIAEKAGVEVRTLHRWRKEEKFAARVRQLSKDLSEAALARAIRRKEYRVNVLAGIQSKILQVIEERGGDPSMADVPGGKTGLLVRQYKVSGDTVVTEYVVDAGTIRELRAVQEQVGKELGQLVDKHEQRFIRGVEDLSDDELAAIVGPGSAGSGEGESASGD